VLPKVHGVDDSRLEERRSNWRLEWSKSKSNHIITKYRSHFLLVSSLRGVPKLEIPSNSLHQKGCRHLCLLGWIEFEGLKLKSNLTSQPTPTGFFYPIVKTRPSTNHIIIYLLPSHSDLVALSAHSLWSPPGRSRSLITTKLSKNHTLLKTSSLTSANDFMKVDYCCDSFCFIIMVGAHLI